MNSDTNIFEPGHSCADIDGVPAEAVQLGYDQHITSFHLVQQPAEPFAARNSHGPGYGFRNNTVRLDFETRRFDLLKLVFRGLLCG